MRTHYLNMNSLICLTTILIASSIAHPPPMHSDPVGVLLNSGEIMMYSVLAEKPNFMPRILQNCSEEARKQFLDIFKDGSVTAEVMKENANKWLESQDSQIQAAFNEKREHIKEMTEKMQKDLPSSSLTDDEKEAVQKIAEIGKNTDLTVQQQYEQAKSLFNDLNESQQQDIRNFVHSEFPHQLHDP